MKKVIKPVEAQYTMTRIIKGNSLKQVLENLQRDIEDEEIGSVWSLQIFETTKRKWQAVLTKSI